MEIACRTGQFGLDGTELTLQDLRESVETFEKAAPVTIGHQMAKMDWFPQFGPGPYGRTGYIPAGEWHGIRHHHPRCRVQ
jgi:hypothetical protein